MGYLVGNWIAQKKNQKYTVNSRQTDTCLITCHQAVFFLKTKEHLIRAGYLSKMGNSRLLFSHFIVGNISPYSLRWTIIVLELHTIVPCSSQRELLLTVESITTHNYINVTHNGNYKNLTKQALEFLSIKMANFCQQVLKPLGSYTWVFTVTARHLESKLHLPWVSTRQISFSLYLLFIY